MYFFQFVLIAIYSNLLILNLMLSVDEHIMNIEWNFIIYLPSNKDSPDVNETYFPSDTEAFLVDFKRGSFDFCE